jgi:hypothetical protein
MPVVSLRELHIVQKEEDVRLGDLGKESQPRKKVGLMTSDDNRH